MEDAADSAFFLRKSANIVSEHNRLRSPRKSFPQSAHLRNFTMASPVERTRWRRGGKFTKDEEVNTGNNMGLTRVLNSVFNCVSPSFNRVVLVEKRI